LRKHVRHSLAADVGKPKLRIGHIPVAFQLAGANAVLAVLTFATGVMLARSLGPEARGVYGALFLWASAASNIFAWGAQLTLARRVAQKPEIAGSVYRAAYRICALGGIIGMLVFLAIVGVATSDQPHYAVALIAVAGLIVPFSMPNAFHVQIELGRGRYASYNLVRSLFALANFATIGTLWLVGVRSLDAFLITLTATVLFASLSAGISIQRSWRRLPTEPAISALAVLRESTPLALTLLLAGLAQQSDRLFASGVFKPSVLGVYLVAASLAQIQGTVGEALAQLFFVRGAGITDLAHIDREWLGSRLRQTILIYVLICAAGLGVAPLVFPIIYGAEFSAGLPLLVLLLPGLALQGMVRPFEEYLRGLHIPGTLALMAGVTLAVTGIGAGFARAFSEPRLLAAAVIVAFGASLLTAAVRLGRTLGIPVSNLLIPKPADAVGLVRAVRRQLYQMRPPTGPA
jgi:O-antigen/teichoic acid export membrane protein